MYRLSDNVRGSVNDLVHSVYWSEHFILSLIDKLPKLAEKLLAHVIMRSSNGIASSLFVSNNVSFLMLSISMMLKIVL